MPDSEEARQDEIPEHLIREKGLGDGARAPLQPPGDPVAPDGESSEMKPDQAAHRDQGQSYVEDPDRD